MFYSVMSNFYRTKDRKTKKEKEMKTTTTYHVEGTNNESNFFALHPTSEVDLNIYGDHMKCID